MSTATIRFSSRPEITEGRLAWSFWAATASGMKHRLSAGLFALSLVTGSTTDAPSSNNVVRFTQAPDGAKVIEIRLAVQESQGSRPSGYLAQRSPQAADEIGSLPPAIAQTYAGKEFSAFEFASLPHGTRYLVVLNEEKGIKFLSRTDMQMCYARVYRVTGDGQPELLREGLQTPGNDVTFPVELNLPGIGATRVRGLKTDIGYSFSGFQNGKPQIYSGRGPGMSVTGSQVLQQGKLTMTVNVPDEMVVTQDTQATLRFEPLKPGLPERTASGKITDFLTLGAARFIVTEMTRDFSSATLAIVAGTLEETLKQQLQLGSQMPPFSQVDLITRKTTTREELMARAKTAGGVIFIFGDLASGGPRYGPYMPPPGGGGNLVLPLPAAEIAVQAAVDMTPKPLVVLVTRQISMEFLYQDLRNKTPDYVLLTDFADPLRTTFRVPQNTGPWYGGPLPPGREPSLRQIFNLPDRLAIAAFDRTGKVVYVISDAGSDFLPSLAAARAALKR